MLAALKERIPPEAMRWLPWAAVVLLGGLNAALIHSQSRGMEPPPLWEGPLMPGKSFSLPLRPAKEQVEKGAAAAAGEGVRFPGEPLRDLVEKRAQETKPTNLREVLKKGYVVQAGSFVLKMGADALVKRLEDQGMHPFVESRHELIQLNNVQAGPFPTLEQAKEAEAKLRAGGGPDMEIQLEETWEGHILSLGKFYLLGYAVQTMEKAQRLNVKPVRMVKVEAALAVRKVLLGPFPKHAEAKEMSSRLAHLGLAVPVIKEWRRQENGEGESGKAVGDTPPEGEEEVAATGDDSGNAGAAGNAESTPPTAEPPTAGGVVNEPHSH